MPNWLQVYTDILDQWGIQIDPEDGSTAPFSTLAAEMATGASCWHGRPVY